MRYILVIVMVQVWWNDDDDDDDDDDDGDFTYMIPRVESDLKSHFAAPNGV